jgi:hypothetical protein
MPRVEEASIYGWMLFITVVILFFPLIIFLASGEIKVSLVGMCFWYILPYVYITIIHNIVYYTVDNKIKLSEAYPEYISFLVVLPCLRLP